MINLISKCVRKFLIGSEFDIWEKFSLRAESFCKATKHNYKTNKAMHILYKRIRNLNLPTDLQLQRFDHTILSIALYIWVRNLAFDSAKLMVKRLRDEVRRYITNSEKSTPEYMLHAELGLQDDW